MKKTILTALAVITMILGAQAQTTTQQNNCTRQDTAKMCQHKCQHKKFDAQAVALHKAKICRQELRLDEKQYNEVFKAYFAFFQTLEANKPEEGQQFDQKVMKDAKNTLGKQMKKTLSEVQFAEWQQMSRNHHKRQGAAPAKGQKPHRPQGLNK